MKYKKIVASMLVAGVLVGAGYGSYGVVAKNIVGNALQQNVVYAEKIQEVANEDLKNEAMNAIKKYYKEVPNFNQLKFKTRSETIEKQKAEIDDTIKFLKESSKKSDGDEAFIKKLEEKKSKIKNGKISIYWISEDEKTPAIYGVDFNDQTKEVLNVMYQPKVDLSKINPKNFVSIEDAKKTAESFIAENKLGDIKNVKFVGKSEYENYYEDTYKGVDTVMFFYQDANDASKKANVILDRTSGKVTYLSIGKGAAAGYVKNAIS